jgi:L-arabinose isomerase
MAFSAKRKELLAEIAEIRRLQMESNREATFGGWTRQAEAAQEMRADRIAALGRELAVLGETAE